MSEKNACLPGLDLKALNGKNEKEEKKEYYPYTGDSIHFPFQLPPTAKTFIL